MAATIKSSPQSTPQKPLVYLDGNEYEAHLLVQAIQTASATRANASYEEVVQPFVAPAATATPATS